MVSGLWARVKVGLGRVCVEVPLGAGKLHEASVKASGKYTDRGPGAMQNLCLQAASAMLVSLHPKLEGIVNAFAVNT